MDGRRRWLILVLRLFACIDLLALFAVFMPSSWMAAGHAMLGMGTLPQAPIIGYLARSASWLYAMHGGAVFVMSMDVQRYAKLITFLGMAALVHGALMCSIDLIEGMPWWWVTLEGPTIAATGALVLALQPHRALMR